MNDVNVTRKVSFKKQNRSTDSYFN